MYSSLVYYSICQIFWKKYRDVSEIPLEYVRYFGKNIGMTLKYNQGWSMQICPLLCMPLLQTHFVSHPCLLPKSRKGCWCWRWCLPMLQSLPFYPSAKATTVPVLWVPLLVIYVLADKLHRFVAGIFIPQYHYPYVVALCFAQVGTRYSDDTHCLYWFWVWLVGEGSQ